MKYTIKKEALESVVKKLCTATNTKFVAIKPINITDKQHLKMAACNENMQIETYISCECKGNATTAETIFVSENFINICKAIVSDTLIMELNEKKLILKSQDANIELPFLENCSLLVADIQEMEDITEHPTQKEYLYRYSVGGNTFNAALSVYGSVVASAGQNIAYNGPCVEVLDQCIKITSTNGYALCSGMIPCISTELNTEIGRTMLPCEVEKALTSCELSDNTKITVTVQEQFVYINAENSLILFRLSNINFPNLNVEELFSIPTECRCKVDTKALANAIRLIELATPEKSKSNGATSIEMYFTGEGLKLQSEASTVTVPATEMEGEGSKTTMSGKLLSQMMGIMPSSVVVDLKDTKKTNGAVLLNGYAYVMPIKK